MFWFFSTEPSASAQSGDSHCQNVHGTFVDVLTDGNTLGTITRGGILNGETKTVYATGSLPTPDPTTVTFIAVLTLTTNHGQLKTSNVYLYDFRTGLFTILARIKPNTGTGIFAGATGVLFAGGNTIGGTTYQSEISGEICFPNQIDSFLESGDIK
jgi:hypothetical protein